MIGAWTSILRYLFEEPAAGDGSGRLIASRRRSSAVGAYLGDLASPSGRTTSLAFTAPCHAATVPGHDRRRRLPRRTVGRLDGAQSMTSSILTQDLQQITVSGVRSVILHIVRPTMGDLRHVRSTAQLSARPCTPGPWRSVGHPISALRELLGIVVGSSNGSDVKERGLTQPKV